MAERLRFRFRSSSAEQLYAGMLQRYPRWTNPGALWGGAKAATTG